MELLQMVKIWPLSFLPSLHSENLKQALIELEILTWFEYAIPLPRLFL